ncbi:alpha/beta hydrolase [Cellulomonas sp.]|uniref:alpha/beta fold hydrolase n=1 Tax=Cellulomonas sp. TaxID=40001 RepID=UPI001B02BFED|nr:alpha/beta hydrolase [Cellulomonas sp.]MBO9553055.1 alpha/beta fold hydrolase [Cellulomonas sp.]
MTSPSTRNSTTVRSYQFGVPPALRAGVRAVDPWAPDLVARGALRLWCRPPHAKHRPTLDGGTQWRLPFGRSHIAGQTWGDGPTVVLVHGWGGHRAQVAGPLVEPLVAAGLRVVAYDAPSHGESGPGALGGRQSTLPELVAALDAVVAAHGPAHAVVAHSLGAAASALAVLDGTPTERLALITPLAAPLTYVTAFGTALGLGDTSRHRLVVRMESLVDRRLSTLDVPVRAANARHRLPPALVLSDRADKEADHEDGPRIARAWPGAELVVTDGLGHRRILRDEETIKRVVAFVGG